MTTKALILCAFLVVASANVTAVNFRHLTVDDGLPQMSVNAIEKDSAGYMWFGTGDGLSRFDGYNFFNFPYQPNKSELVSNTISSLKMANNHILWIGTSKGVSRVNTKDFSFLPPIDVKPENVLQLVRDNDTMWVVQHSAISQFKADKRQTFLSIDGENIFAMAIVELGIWVGTNQKLYFYSFEDKTLLPIPAINQHVDIIFIYSADELLLATSDGLVKFNIKTEHVQRFPIGSSNDVDNSGDILFVEKHSNGNIWIGSWNQGIFELNPDLQILNQFSYVKNNPTSLSNNEPKAMYIDDEVIWLGNQGGGINMLWERARFLNHVGSNSDGTGLSHPLIRSIGETNDGLLVGTSDGLNRLTLNAGLPVKVELARITGDCTAENRSISAITTTQDGKIWVASTGAGKCFLFEYDALHNELNAIPHTADILPVGANQIIELADGNKLLLTVSGIYQFSDHEFKRIPAFEVLDEQVVWRGMQDAKGRLWLGTHTRGIYLYSADYQLIAHFEHDLNQSTSLSSNYVKSFLQDNKGNIWVGTTAGLNKYNEKLQTFDVITQANGLSNNTIYGVLEDEPGFIWLSTNKGINRLAPDSLHVWHLSAADGLQSSEFNTGAFFKQKNGNLVFGGINGINILQPANLSPKAKINKIKIGQLNLSSAASSVDQHLNADDFTVLELDHLNTRTQLSISSLDFINQKQFQYAYQLVGQSDSWFELPKGENLISFSALPAGSYQLRLKSRNNDGIWSEPQASLKLSVVPAPWLSPLAYFSYLLALVFVLFGLYVWRTNNLRKKQQKLEELIFERTDTINQQAQVLVLQNEVLQKTITEKDNVFAHVTHEFKTPLTLVLNPLQTLKAEASEPQKPLLELIERNSQRLNHLVDQLVGFSEISQNNTDSANTVSNINHKIELYLSDFSGIFKEKSIKVVFLADQQYLVALPLNILELVLSNVISNAVKYCAPNGCIQLSLTATSTDFCNIAISNTHKKLSDEQLERMFERFYRLPMHQTKVPGTGLGLALVKDALTMFNCEISASNTLDAIEITFTLPLASNQQAPVNDELPILSSFKLYSSIPNQLEIKTQLVNDASQPLLLIIEDDPDMRTLLHSELNRDFDLLIFSQPEEGIEAAIEHIPDAILLDYMLPQLNGDAVTMKLRANILTCHIPILILTAKATKQTKLSTMRALVDDVMAKPFDSEELLARLHSLLEIRQLLSRKYQAGFENVKVSQPINPVEQQFRLKLDEILGQHYSEETFDVVKLASLLCVSERQLQRKCKSTLDVSPKSYIRDYRLLQAKDKLLAGEQITRVGYDCGFSSSAYFTQCFRAYFGCSPSEYTKRTEK